MDKEEYKYPDERIIGSYRGYSIEEIDYDGYSLYKVYDENGIGHGGSLSNFGACKQWIDMLIKDKERKEKKA